MFLLFLRLCLLWLFLNNPIVLGQEISSIELGRSIFDDGIGRDNREINATFHGVTLSGSAVACSRCHGKNARGGGEAFVIAPDIRWLNLSKTYSSRRAGISRAPYDQMKFAKVVRTGISSDGSRLDPAMPRIDLADDEVESLIEYLTNIDQTLQTNNPRPIILGLLPSPGKNPYADALYSKLRTCLDRGMGFPVAAIDILYFDTPSDAVKKLNARLQESPNTLILTPFIIGWEREYAAVTQSWKVTTVLPFSFLDPPVDNEWYFYFPGIESQLIALLDSIKRDGYSQLLVIYNPKDSLSYRLKSLVLREAALSGISVYFKDQEITSKNAKTAKLWLTPVSEYELSEYTNDDLMLAPVFFYTPVKVSENSGNANWRIAYPYAPDPRNNGQWLTPVDVWASAACEFMMRMGNDSLDYTNLSEMNLKWETNSVLSGKSELKQLSKEVFISNVSNK